MSIEYELMGGGITRLWVDECGLGSGQSPSKPGDSGRGDNDGGGRAKRADTVAPGTGWGEKGRPAPPAGSQFILESVITP